MRATEFSLAAIIGFLCFVHGSYGRKPEKELTMTNEPVKTFQGPYGDIIDCIFIDKQPAFDLPMLKDHIIQQKPAVLPKDLDVNALPDDMKPIRLFTDDLCPSGSVPIRRTNGNSSDTTPKFDPPHTSYRFAILRMIKQEFDGFYGAAARVRADNPNCVDGQSSEASIWIGSDVSNQKNFIKAGWKVSPLIYGDSRSRLSIHWTADGFHKTGCYDLQCPGFIQVTNKVVIGVPILDNYGSGVQTSGLYFYVFQEAAYKNWWLALADSSSYIYVGYWPKELFSSLIDGGSMLHFGGSASAHLGQEFPSMGSGQFPGDYFTSNYFRLIKYVNKTNYLTSPRANAAYTYVDNFDCYRIRYDENGGPLMGHIIYMGGPGGIC